MMHLTVRVELGWGWGTWRQRVAERQMHDRDLLLLRDDDLLGKPSQARVLAVAQFDERHVDRALVVGDHHSREVTIRVTGDWDVHVRMHALDRLVHHDLEIRLYLSIAGASSTSNHEGKRRKSGIEAAHRSTSLHFRAPCNFVRNNQKPGRGNDLRKLQ